jgi:hypothetical protein
LSKRYTAKRKRGREREEQSKSRPKFEEEADSYDPQPSYIISRLWEKEMGSSNVHKNLGA